jgi:hypothetical protein
MTKAKLTKDHLLHRTEQALSLAFNKCKERGRIMPMCFYETAEGGTRNIPFRFEDFRDEALCADRANCYQKLSMAFGPAFFNMALALREEGDIPIHISQLRRTWEQDLLGILQLIAPRSVVIVNASYAGPLGVHGVEPWSKVIAAVGIHPAKICGLVSAVTSQTANAMNFSPPTEIDAGNIRVFASDWYRAIYGPSLS